jgi:hypothetical protein
MNFNNSIKISMIKRIRSYFSIFLLIFLLSAYFFLTRSDFQQDSELLVLSAILSGKYDLYYNQTMFGLGYINDLDYQALLSLIKNFEFKDFTFTAYESQVGLQGWLIYFVSRYINSSITLFQMGASTGLATVLVLISIELYKKYGTLMAVIFYLISFSPWIASYGPNLYWLAFTWFIPMWIGLLILNNFNYRFFYFPLLFIAIFIKSLMGYEFLTVIMLSSVLFLVAEFVTLSYKDKIYAKKIFNSIFLIGIISLFAFTSALIIHSLIRGDGNLILGFNEIYQNDILRRTFGDPSNFDDALFNSLNASVFDVLFIYFTRNIGFFAFILLITNVILVLFDIKNKVKISIHDVTLLLVSLVTTLSWYILAKSHSFIHTHMNFVLYYFGYFQISTYIIIKSLILRTPKWIKEQFHLSQIIKT